MAGQLHPRDNLRRLVETFALLDEDLYTGWGEMLELSIEPNELDARSRAVLRVSLDSIAKLSIPTIQADIEEAFQAGSNVHELLEAMVHAAYYEGGSHGTGRGLDALERAIVARESSGVEVPFRGEGLAPEDWVHEAPWPVPAVLPYQTPNPRYQHEVLKEYNPDLAAASAEWGKARFGLRKELTRRMQELIFVANDVAIVYPSPYLDHHFHASFEIGLTTQELLEAVLVGSTGLLGTRSDVPTATNIEGGWVALHHGVETLQRVIRQREEHNLWAPRDKNSPKKGKAALTL